MTPRKLTGPAMRGELTRAMNANSHAQANLRRLLNEQPGPQTQAILLAKTASFLGENLEALMELQRVIAKQPQ